MNEPLESILCTRCGLCCNGSFLADVELSAREASRLEFAGLDIEDDSLLLQPCAALNGARCSMYAHRPKCCRTFECLLLQRAKRGQISIATATRQIDDTLKLVQQIHALLATMPETESNLPLKERCLEAMTLAEPDSTNSIALEAAVASLDDAVNKLFLQSDHANSP
jgi:Fe-S-cluster containining protein